MDKTVTARTSKTAEDVRIIELEEMVSVLRDALQKAPGRHVVQHHLYDAWVREVRDPALEVTR